jgi:hypothetical protein
MAGSDDMRFPIHMKLFLALVAVCSLAACFDMKQPFESASPYVSMRVRETDRKELLEAASLAQQGKFDDAKKLLDRTAVPKVVHVAIGNAGPNPDLSKSAVQAAVTAWNDAFKGERKIELSSKVESAEIVVDFVPTAMENTDGYVHPGCSGTDIRTEDESGKPGVRKERLQVATGIPGMLNAQHSAESLTHLVARGIGAYYGLASVSATDALMGPDTHTPQAVGKPGPTELQIVAQVDAYRDLVASAIAAKKAPAIEFPALKFTQTTQNAGECWRGEMMTFEFEYKNEGKAPLEIEAKPSCGCTVAKFDKVIQPGQTGKLTATLNTTGFKGKIGKSIEVFANTPDGGKVTLVIAGNVKPTYSISPEDPVVFSIDDKETSHREITIRPLEDANTKILSVQAQVKYVTAKLEAGSDEKGPLYKVNLDFAPEAPRGRYGMALAIKTDSKREPNVSLPVTFEKGIYAMPPTMFVGIVNADTKFPINRTLSVVRKDKAFKVIGVSVDDPSVNAAFETVKEGHEYKITMTCKGGWAAGTVNRKMKIKTDDPDQPEIEVAVLANVMARTGGN